MQHKEANDYELLYLIQIGSEEAYYILFEKYKGMVTKIAKKYYKNYLNLSIDINDFILEGYVGLDKAIHQFKDEYKFQSFLFLCIERQIMGCIRNLTAKKHSLLNQSIYYEDLSSEDNNIKDVLEDISLLNPEETLLLNEENNQLTSQALNILKGLELDVFIYKRKGFTNQEISYLLKKDIKSINNALNRIRKKKHLLGY